MFFQNLYEEISVPKGVLEELDAGIKSGEEAPDIKKYLWIKVERIRNSDFIKMIPDLGRGEAEVITLGCESEGSLLVMDDFLGRAIAKLQGLTFTGTAGILLRAKEEKIIPEVGPILQRLKALGFYLNDSLINTIMTLADEK